MPSHSSDYFAHLIAEVTCLLANPEIACDPRGALAGMALQDLCRCYERARDREQAQRRFYAQELTARFPQLAGRAA